MEAAERQLAEAIEMHFSRRDLLAIHTIVGACSSILCDLAKSKDMASVVRLSEHVRDDKRKQWISLINEPQNFLKHADKDPDGVFEFHPFILEVLMVEACMLIEQLQGVMFAEARIYIIWFALKHPDHIFSDEFINRISIAGLTADLVDDYDFS